MEMISTGTYSGVFADANVGIDEIVTITSTYSGADVGNHSVTNQSRLLETLLQSPTAKLLFQTKYKMQLIAQQLLVNTFKLVRNMQHFHLNIQPLTIRIRYRQDFNS